MNFSETPATYALIVATVGASLYALFGDRGFVDAYAFRVGAVRKGAIARYVTSGFLHGDLLHLGVNMLTFWSFGPAVERVLGTDGLLLLYFGSMIAGGLMIMAVNAKNPDYAAIGASGAVSGVVIAFCLFRPFDKLYVFPLPFGVPAALFAVLFVLFSAQLMRAPGRVVSHEGHLGGALGGLVLTLLMQPDAALRWLP